MKKITDITGDWPDFKPIGNDIFELNQECKIFINFEDKSYWKFDLYKGFISNMRSGPDLLNYFVPKMMEGSSLTWTLALLAHDAGYTWYYDKITAKLIHLISKEDLDNMLYQASKISGMNFVQSFLIDKGLSWFGNSAYEEPNEGIYHMQAYKYEITKYEI
jgi:hypothetical protein